MKEEILTGIKITCDRMKKERERQKNIWKRIEELEKNQLIKEYLLLKNEVKALKSKETLSDDEILEISIEANIYRNKETNNIYINTGETMINSEIYHRYINIEDRIDSYLIPKNKCTEFETNHTVIKSNKEYQDIQKEFIQTALEKGQEHAIKKILVKNRG